MNKSNLKNITTLIFLITYLSCLSFDGFSNNSNPISLIEQSKVKGDSILADSLYKIALKYFRINMDTSLMFAEASAKLSERIDYTDGRFNAYRGLTAIGVRANDLDKSLLYVQKGLDLIIEKSLDQSKKLDLLLNKGSAYLLVNDLGNGINANIEALSIAIDNDFKDKTAKIYNNMGVLYRKMNDYPNAVKTYHDGIDIRIQLNDSVGLATTYYNLGAVYAKMDSSQLTYNAINKAKAIFTNLGMLKEAKECDVALGSAAFDLHKYVEAYNLLSSLEKDKTVKIDLLDNYRMHINLSRLEILKENIKNATKLLDEIKDIEKTNFIEEKISYYQVRIDLGNLEKNYKNTIKYTLLYQENIEELTNKKTLEFREEMNSKYQTLQKDFEIKTLAAEQEMTEAKLKVAQQRNIGFILGIILLSFFLWSLYQLYKKIKGKNAIISQANADKEILLKEIHHRVKNNLQVVTSLLSMQERKVTDVDTKDALRSSKTRIQSMSILHQFLYQGDNLKEVKADRYISSLIDNIMDSYVIDNKIDIIIDVDPVLIDVDTLIPLGLISNELICNSIKHAFKGKEEGKLIVSLKKSADKIILEVSDNGIGIKGGILPHKPGSLGKRLINSFVQQLNGDINIKNENGTTIRITIDKSDIFIAVD